jgi:hypothetical protein
MKVPRRSAEVRRVVELECLSADGHPILVAVDHHNRERLRVVLADPGSLDATIGLLWSALDVLDPLPSLVAVRPGAHSTRRERRPPHDTRRPIIRLITPEG